MRQELGQFITFCIVGGIGFLVDAGILGLLVHGFGADPLLSRLLSFPCAMTVTWYLNRRVTFSHAVSDEPFKNRYLGKRGKIHKRADHRCK